MAPTTGNGKVCYLEIPARDVAVSSAFYEGVFAWRTRRRGDGALAFDDGVGEVSGSMGDRAARRRPARACSST